MAHAHHDFELPRWEVPQIPRLPRQLPHSGNFHSCGRGAAPRVLDLCQMGTEVLHSSPDSSFVNEMNLREDEEATNGFRFCFLLSFDINRWVPGGISRTSANSLWDSTANFLFNEHVSFHVQRHIRQPSSGRYQ